MSGYSPSGMNVVPRMVGTSTVGWTVLAEPAVVNQTAPAAAAASAHCLYFPFLVPAVCVVRRVWWANGDTVSASYTLDVGVYADAGAKPGTRLVSCGATAQGTASQVQFADVTDTTLAPGRYWLAISASTASATLFRSAHPGTAGGAGVNAAFAFYQDGVHPLPATASPVESLIAYVYLFGFATTASP